MTPAVASMLTANTIGNSGSLLTSDGAEWILEYFWNGVTKSGAPRQDVIFGDQGDELVHATLRMLGSAVKAGDTANATYLERASEELAEKSKRLNGGEFTPIC